MNLGIGEDFRYNIKGTIDERKIDKQDFLKIKNCYVKDNVKRMKRHRMGDETHI